jgi:hypothetical protein
MIKKDVTILATWALTSEELASIVYQILHDNELVEYIHLDINEINYRVIERVK